MKKLIIIGLLALVAVIGGLTVMTYMGVSSNDAVLADIKDNKDVVVLKVSGMT